MIGASHYLWGDFDVFCNFFELHRTLTVLRSLVSIGRFTVGLLLVKHSPKAVGSYFQVSLLVAIERPVKCCIELSTRLRVLHSGR